MPEKHVLGMLPSAAIEFGRLLYAGDGTKAKLEDEKADNDRGCNKAKVRQPTLEQF